MVGLGRMRSSSPALTPRASKTGTVVVTVSNPTSLITILPVRSTSQLKTFSKFLV